MATILESTFNSDLAHQWSLAASDLDGPSTMEQILQFLKARLNTALPQAQLKKASSSQVFKQPPSTNAKSKSVYRVGTAARKCTSCNQEGHTLSRCSTFREWDQARRHKHVKTNKYCYNCLSHSHGLKECHSSYSCRTCNGRHHTLLHRDQVPAE